MSKDLFQGWAKICFRKGTACRYSILWILSSSWCLSWTINSGAGSYQTDEQRKRTPTSNEWTAYILNTLQKIIGHLSCRTQIGRLGSIEVHHHDISVTGDVQVIASVQVGGSEKATVTQPADGPVCCPGTGPEAKNVRVLVWQPLGPRLCWIIGRYSRVYCSFRWWLIGIQSSKQWFSLPTYLYFAGVDVAFWLETWQVIDQEQEVGQER